jgi:3-dehydroquinate synthase class II
MLVLYMLMCWSERRRNISANWKPVDEVSIINAAGEQRKGIVGRVKIERRPLMLVEADLKGKIVKTILQNAETIKLVTKGGKPCACHRSETRRRGACKI